MENNNNVVSHMSEIKTTYHGLCHWYKHLVEKYGWIVMHILELKTFEPSNQDYVDIKECADHYILEFEKFIRKSGEKLNESSVQDNFYFKKDLEIMQQKIRLLHQHAKKVLSKLLSENILDRIELRGGSKKRNSKRRLKK